MPGTPRRRRRLLRSPVLQYVRPIYEERLTARGRYLFWTAALLAVLGLDTRRTQVFSLFAIAAAGLLFALAFWVARAPRVRFECPLPDHATVGTPVRLRARIEGPPGRRLSDLRLAFPRPPRWSTSIAFHPREAFFDVAPDKLGEVAVELRVARRGRYLLKGPTLRRTDPLRLATGAPRSLPDQILICYPRFYSLDDFMVPIGRRYQPGGIPLSSSLGESIEFVGTRDYREGDPVRSIHWRSFARRGRPVVKEYQEEYFCRIAIILDTFSRRRPRPEDVRVFESAISVVASIADFFSRSEYVVDILAAGPDLYEVSAGRSLAYLENILDVLACLEACPDPPFQTIGPALFEKLGQITTVVAVLQDWDDAREQFLRQVKSLGTAVRVVIVHEGPTAKPWAGAEELGEVSVMSPADVEHALQASAPPGVPAEAARA
ncbi:MAG TPA: DUF58 domain-containing protein [Vicinamibacteria bacterium]|nr:DUF58 domain-containing protein [Vicinamibacteria bacterium]